MPLYNITVRAQEDAGAFADREFSIFLNSSPMDQAILVDQTAAFASYDGTTWTRVPNVGGRKVSHGGARWVISGAAAGLSKTAIRHSVNGRQWTSKVIPGLIAAGTAEDPFITYLAGRWWVHGAVSATETGWITTVDLLAEEWHMGPITGLLTDGREACSLATSGPVILAAFTGDAALYVSRNDGGKFTALPSGPPIAAGVRKTLFYSDRIWLCAAGDTVYTSYDLFTWTARTIPSIPATLAVSQITYSNGRLLACFAKDSSEVGSVGTCATSDDLGRSWSLRSFDPFIIDSASLCSTSAICVNGRWIMASTAASSTATAGLRISANGVAWTRQTVPDSTSGAFGRIGRLTF